MTSDTIQVTYKDYEGNDVTHSTTQLDLWDSYLVTQSVLLKLIHSSVQPAEKVTLAETLKSVSEAALDYKTTMGTTV